MEIKKASRQVAMEQARAQSPALFDRLVQNADTSQPDQCWHWRKAKDKDGYGTLKVAGRSVKAHKAMHLLFHPGSSAPLVRHLCNNPSCVNPIHLRDGTPLDNALDRVAAGRGGNLKGESNGRAKLTAAQVQAIRVSAATGAALARQFGISKAMACRIRRGAAWSHV
jgi:hypothetical protein